MPANSRQIESSQAGIHKTLQQVVHKHLENPFKKPFAQHTIDAFESVRPEVETALEQGAGLMFDSGCGTAMSTRKLAVQYPDALVIGIDRSAQRLGKAYNQVLPANARLLQAECADFWRLAVKAGWRLEKHSIYYPNPYPKASQLKRRWHAHPAFPALLELGGKLELRSNWKTYVDEFCQAMAIAGFDVSTNQISPDEPMTLFERKYQRSGQLLYACEVALG